ncbi:hypothetical protein [Lyngbya confervoides]|nr:hypothetical protein [Lyngbya confervoides]
MIEPLIVATLGFWCGACVLGCFLFMADGLPKSPAASKQSSTSKI